MQFNLLLLLWEFKFCEHEYNVSIRHKKLYYIEYSRRASDAWYNAR